MKYGEKRRAKQLQHPQVDFWSDRAAFAVIYATAMEYTESIPTPCGDVRAAHEARGLSCEQLDRTCTMSLIRYLAFVKVLCLSLILAALTYLLNVLILLLGLPFRIIPGYSTLANSIWLSLHRFSRRLLDQSLDLLD